MNLKQFFEERHFASPDQAKDDFSPVLRSAAIRDDSGNVIFEQKEFEVPEKWSQLATDIVASKFAYGSGEDRERSAFAIVDRVVKTIADWGYEDLYFPDKRARDNFEHDLRYLCLNQMASFNSPVWFNVGVTQEKSDGFGFSDKAGIVTRVDPAEHRPQCSACFIQSVSDDMHSIMDIAKSEAMLFRRGSGTGADLSTLRSCKETLSGGGKPSGPISFMKVYDRIASIVKSGGKTRRAARMQTLKCTHPDVLEFIRFKKREEDKARALIREGYSSNFNGEAYDTVSGQSTNLSVRLTDEFLTRAEERDASEWTTRGVLGGVYGTGMTASEILDEIAACCHDCGDPGVQYEDTIQRWHTCPSFGRINSSNPCSEYMFLDNTACNLSSLNLKAFFKPGGDPHKSLVRFRDAVRTMVTAMDIIVDRSSYPTLEIARNSVKFRTLGLGFANLGAMLMSFGVPYDSNDARTIAATVTCLMHGYATEWSMELAESLGCNWSKDEAAYAKVLARHIEDACMIPDSLGSPSPFWDVIIGKRTLPIVAAAKLSRLPRNAQVTVIAPTGTIAFMMDCDTTGIEPDIALVKSKKLAGGGTIEYVNRSVQTALINLGYDENTVGEILDYVLFNGTIEGCLLIKDEHVPVFDCAFPVIQGGRSIAWKAHIDMMAAVQPFLSGAISKTVNMPRETTAAEIREAILYGWKRGLKALALYRDGSKGDQPLSAGKAKRDEATASVAAVPAAFVSRREMATSVDPRRCKFSLNGQDGYIFFGLDDAGRLREIFTRVHKLGDSVGSLVDIVCAVSSLALQYGCPIERIVDHLTAHRYDPNGFTGNSEVPICQSVTDFIGRIIQRRYSEPIAAIVGDPGQSSIMTTTLSTEPKQRYTKPAPAAGGIKTLCRQCGLTVIGVGCSVCPNCGTASGACG